MRNEWQRIAVGANRIAGQVRNSTAPVLNYRTATREQLIAWLVWCDPNGSHTDAQAKVEGIDPYTLETAWEQIAAILEDS